MAHIGTLQQSSQALLSVLRRTVEGTSVPNSITEDTSELKDRVQAVGKGIGTLDRAMKAYSTSSNSTPFKTLRLFSLHPERWLVRARWTRAQLVDFEEKIFAPCEKSGIWWRWSTLPALGVHIWSSRSRWRICRNCASMKDEEHRIIDGWTNLCVFVVFSQQQLLTIVHHPEVAKVRRWGRGR